MVVAVVVKVETIGIWNHPNRFSQPTLPFNAGKLCPHKLHLYTRQHGFQLPELSHEEKPSYTFHSPGWSL